MSAIAEDIAISSEERSSRVHISAVRCAIAAPRRRIACASAATSARDVFSECVALSDALTWHSDLSDFFFIVLIARAAPAQGAGKRERRPFAKVCRCMARQTVVTLSLDKRFFSGNVRNPVVRSSDLIEMPGNDSKKTFLKSAPRSWVSVLFGLPNPRNCGLA